jgi:hypothetical protein
LTEVIGPDSSAIQPVKIKSQKFVDLIACEEIEIAGIRVYGGSRREGGKTAPVD